MKFFSKRFSYLGTKFRSSQAGATMVEYVLLAALVALIAVVGLRELGAAVSAEFSEINSLLLTT